MSLSPSALLRAAASFAPAAIVIAPAAIVIAPAAIVIAPAVIVIALAAIFFASPARSQDLVETAPVLDAPGTHVSFELRGANAAFAPPGSIDRAAHTLATYELADVERIADEYRSSGMRWFYNRHTPELLATFLDSTDVPLIEYDFGWHRNPVMTSQAALAFYNGYLDTGSEEYLKVFKANVDWLLENHDEHYLRYGFSWRHGGERMQSGWISAMGQGEALGAGVRTVADSYPIWNIPDRDQSLYCLHGLDYPFYHETHLRQFNDYLAYFDIPEFEAAAELFRLHPTISGSHETLDFGVVAVGDTLERSLTFYNDGNAPLEILGLNTGRSEFILSTSAWHVAAGDSLTMNVGFAPVAEGAVGTTLRVTSNAPRLQIGLVGTAVVTALTAEPDAIEFGDVLALARDTLEFRVRTRTAEVIPIDSVTSGSSVFVVSDTDLSVAPNQWTVVPLIFAPTLTGEYATDVVLHYGGDRLEIAASGRGVSPIRVAAGDGSPLIDFGNVFIGTSDTLEAIVENIGAAPVTITGVRSPRTDVEILVGATREVVIGGGEAHSYAVAFSPLETGSLSDSLEVTTNVSLQPHRVALRGEVTSGVGVDDGVGIPETFGLDQNYPNPFGASTHIRYQLPERSRVRLFVVNVLGQVVRMVENDYQNPGHYSLEIHLRDLPSGIYFFRMEAGGFTQTRRMVHL